MVDNWIWIPDIKSAKTVHEVNCILVSQSTNYGYYAKQVLFPPLQTAWQYRKGRSLQTTKELHVTSSQDANVAYFKTTPQYKYNFQFLIYSVIMISHPELTTAALILQLRRLI